MGQDESKIGKFDGEIVCEPPNNHLNRFEGRLTWQGKQYSLDNEKILLRGCVLRNTQWCYGVVIFAGRDTKLMQNSGKTKFKRTSIDRLLNFIILGVSSCSSVVFNKYLSNTSLCLRLSELWHDIIFYVFVESKSRILFSSDISFLLHI